MHYHRITELTDGHADIDAGSRNYTDFAAEVPKGKDGLRSIQPTSNSAKRSLDEATLEEDDISSFKRVHIISKMRAKRKKYINNFLFEE